MKLQATLPFRTAFMLSQHSLSRLSWEGGERRRVGWGGGGPVGEWYKDLTRNERDLPGLSGEDWAPARGLTQLIT